MSAMFWKENYQTTHHHLFIDYACSTALHDCCSNHNPILLIRAWKKSQESQVLRKPINTFFLQIPRRHFTTSSKDITPKWTQHQTWWFPVLNNHESKNRLLFNFFLLLFYDIKPSLVETPRNRHVSALLALSWVTASAQTCVCRRLEVSSDRLKQ